MTFDEQSTPATRSAYLAAAAIDHARLSYAYLNDGNLDAYASLFEHDAVWYRPDTTVRGREELVRFQEKRAGRFSVTEVISEGSGEHVVVLGRTTEPAFGAQVGVAEVFTVSGRGLFTSLRTFYFVLPPSEVIPGR
ncbi:nuclear transport factor 2 family protein [Nonomuraea jiangxiensis]|uniref:SnoaL-like domain-containing protein n=1 Tax=Nonomuraea jiangxiensis TaxID=633440 RepID=A0A1G9QUT6_9ACTN|nr:nuclear transport factor 2 family protein [Nonomuraea jiangxiensis]SDM14630.1 SnoaL-like domain-containing protein [Nonomuraea jiangxiensis]